MASLSLKHIYKVYPNGTKAVNDFNMEIEDKEFIVFVGPSGCGKSTTLRMIAGLEDISAGELMIGDTVVNDVEPKDRDIAMVFQNYALYPHMTVYQNIAFGLTLRKMPKEEIHRRVTEAAEILGITEYLGKKPKEMSGGQRQRVSLGRAIVREPKVMLLDEPLSNLDAKLRTQMRSEIAKLHAKLNTTFIYVTHDQVEAMTMGTRIVVMKNGFVQQIDTPKNLYNYPGNKFVAGFIGTPQMNFFEGSLLKRGEEVDISFDYSEAKVTVPYSMMYKTRPAYLDGKSKVYIGLRPEAVSVNPEKIKTSKAVIKVKVSHKEELGNQTLIYGDINMDGDGYTETSTRIIIEADAEIEFNSGDVIDVALDLTKVHLFDKETELSVLPRIPEYNYVKCEVKADKLSFLGVQLGLPEAIKCPDGEYELLIPTDAVSVGGDIKVKVTGCEKISGKNLVSFELGDRIAYGVLDEEVKNGTIGIDVDLKKISIVGENGAAVVEAMPEKIDFEGKLLKEKVAEEIEVNGKTKKKKVIKFFLQVGDAKFGCPDDIFRKLVAAIGVRKVFGEELLFECGPYDLKLVYNDSENGISADVVEIADYGKEKFAVCETGGRKIYVGSENINTGSVRLVPEIDKLSIIQKDKSIRII
ncbi:MAG: sn-glycerol-3-phosphate ABC transporter ATP-binding protein UgpC [Clostridia bacterium]|nr:sn-glycerol-3-phosphate ABC transporter ATP-binding protein UgpC [Clostridia bacterium]